MASMSWIDRAFACLRGVLRDVMMFRMVDSADSTVADLTGFPFAARLGGAVVSYVHCTFRL